MDIVFNPEGHKYTSNNEDNITWRSVTSVVGMFKEKFDAELQAKKCSKNIKSKWHGYTPKEILEMWRTKGEQSANLGNWYHNQRESDIGEFSSIERRGKTVPIFKPIIIDGIKQSPSQKLEEGVYPEHMVYMKSASLCGQSDRVEVVDGFVDINDYKTNEEIKLHGFRSWDGIPKMMKAPVSHLEDCDINHYALQLSLYMYIILKHNPKLKAGNMTIEHIVFEELEKDKLGNRVLKRNEDGNPIVKEIVRYSVPYLKEEVINIINYLHETK